MYDNDTQPLAPEERAARQAAAAQRAAERRAEQQQRRAERRQREWDEAGYVSANLALADEDEEDDEDYEEATDEDEESEAAADVTGSDDDAGSAAATSFAEPTATRLVFVDGDVTMPQRGRYAAQPAIIVHCVDTTGRWGRGGVFTALDQVDPTVGQRYETAGDMRDLHLGDVHLLPLAADTRARRSGARPGDAVALVVAQTRDRYGQLSAVQLPALETALVRISRYARRHRATVHLPRIGQRTPGFDWYRTERCLRKCLSARGVPAFVYYFVRRPRPAPAPAVAIANDDAGATDADDTDASATNADNTDADNSDASATDVETTDPVATSTPRNGDDDDAATDVDEPASPATLTNATQSDAAVLDATLPDATPLDATLPDAAAVDATLPDAMGEDAATLGGTAAEALTRFGADLFADLAEVSDGGGSASEDEGRVLAQRGRRHGKRRAEVGAAAPDADVTSPAQRRRTESPPPADEAEATVGASTAPALLDLFTGCTLWFADGASDSDLARAATFYDADGMTPSSNAMQTVGRAVRPHTPPVAQPCLLRLLQWPISWMWTAPRTSWCPTMWRRP